MNVILKKTGKKCPLCRRSFDSAKRHFVFGNSRYYWTTEGWKYSYEYFSICGRCKTDIHNGRHLQKYEDYRLSNYGKESGWGSERFYESPQKLSRKRRQKQRSRNLSRGGKKFSWIEAHNKAVRTTNDEKLRNEYNKRWTEKERKEFARMLHEDHMKRKLEQQKSLQET